MTEQPFADLEAQMHLALIEAQSEFGSIRKTRTANIPTKGGGSYSYKYADLSDVLEEVRKPLRDHGFAIVQDVSERGAVRTRLLHASGHSIESGFLQLPPGETAQSAGAAITYARRYSLSALLGISTEDDTDASAAADAGMRAADGGPGGVSETPSTPPGSPPSFAVDPTVCDHQRASGAPAKFIDAEKIERCQKCGLPWIVVMEGTTADLGPAHVDPLEQEPAGY